MEKEKLIQILKHAESVYEKALIENWNYSKLEMYNINEGLCLFFIAEYEYDVYDILNILGLKPEVLSYLCAPPIFIQDDKYAINLSLKTRLSFIKKHINCLLFKANDSKPFNPFRKTIEQLDTIGIRCYVRQSSNGKFGVEVYRKKNKQESKGETDWEMIREGHLKTYSNRIDAENAAIDLGNEIFGDCYSVEEKMDMHFKVVTPEIIQQRLEELGYEFTDKQ